MKTMRLAKSVLAILAVCFTLAGTTSCSKEDNGTIVPQASVDPKLLGSWEEIKSVFNSDGNYTNLTKLTFEANREGEEVVFDTDEGVVFFERISTFRWFVKSPGVIHLENSLNEEGDIHYSLSENKQSLQLTFPSGHQIRFKRIN